MTKKYNVVGLGNALIDILSSVSDNFYAAQTAKTPMVHGKFNPVDAMTADQIYQGLSTLTPAPVITTGGSVANTIMGIASFGGSGAFIGKTGADHFGTVFASELRANNVTPSLIVDQGGNATGYCVILVTSDGERTLNSFIGAGDMITAADMSVNQATIADAQVLLLEGYQFNAPHTKLAFNHAANIANQNGTAVAFTVSSEHCIRQNHADMMALLTSGKVKILFANEGETKTLAGKSDFNEAAKALSQLCETVVTTCGPKGAIVSHKGQSIHVPAEKIAKLVDTTGAGDQFAAGFLYGYTHGFSMEKCARLGAMAAAEVIQVMGPRPPIPYAQLVQKLNQPSQP